MSKIIPLSEPSFVGNEKKYLNEAIDSILKQSYQNFEIIFFDNASTDKSLDIIKNYQDIRINI